MRINPWIAAVITSVFITMAVIGLAILLSSGQMPDIWNYIIATIRANPLLYGFGLLIVGSIGGVLCLHYFE